MQEIRESTRKFYFIVTMKARNSYILSNIL